MNKKIWMLCGIGLFLLSLHELEARRRTTKQKDQQEEKQLDLDIDFEGDEVEPSLLEEAAAEAETFNIATKRRQVVTLVEDGVAYLKEKPLYQVFHAFTHEKSFTRGELYIFAFDLKGTCLAHGQEEDMLWKDMYDSKDEYGTPIFKNMLATVKKGSGWLTYQWRGATEVTYVKSVTKDGEDFIVGSGFYPHSMESSVVSLVKGAVAVFNKVKKAKDPLSQAFSSFSYKLGRFVKGELYLYAISFEGKTMAHGERPDLIGTDALGYRDATGRYINKEIIEKLEKTGEGIWIEYISKRAPKKTYAEKVTDNEGNNYFIVCGYYPDTNQKQVIDLVRKGYIFMKKHGLSQAVDEFSDEKINTYRYGDLYLVVYNYEGICRAHGKFREYIGRNRSNEQDDDGVYWVREIIKKAKAGGGWVSAKRKNVFEIIYVEPIKTGAGDFIIVSGFYPVSKMETMILLARSAASYFGMLPTREALRKFTKRNGRFIRGDLSVFVFDSTGICLAFGDDYDFIWENMLDVKDDDGKPYVKMLINTGMRGSGKVSFRLYGMPALAYVEKVEKEGRTLIVGSHYYK